MKFDVAVTNSPFQRGNGNNGGPLWPIFSELGMQITKDDGYVLYLTPATWVNGKSIYQSIFKKYNPIFLNINECKKFFKSGFNTFSYWLVKKQNYEGNTTIVSLNSNGSVQFEINLEKYPYLPYSWIPSENVLRFHEKIMNLPKMKFISGPTTSFNNNRFSNKKSKIHSYPVVYSKKRIIYSSQPEFLQNTQKIIFWNTSDYIDKFNYDQSIIEDAIGRQVTCLIPPDGTDPKIIKDTFSGKFFRFCDKIYRDGAYFNGSCFPYIDISKKWTDQDLYNHFSLSPEIIEYIESMEWNISIKPPKQIFYNHLSDHRLKRRKKTSEDFTPDPLVNEMLDKLPSDIWTDPSKTFVEPAAGNGNFVIAILRRKLDAGHPPLEAISTIYGVELMPDNVEEMKDRLLIELPSLTSKEEKIAKRIINHNIVCHNSLTWDFENWESNDVKAKPLF